MNDYEFLEKVKQMPPDYQQEVKDFIEFIFEKKIEPSHSKKERKSGQLKGKVWMSDDFIEPMEDLKDYM
jgi:mRNA-degrading endonuclease RelE of RelBE toxin-antitoxin system